MTRQCNFNVFSNLYNICNEYQINSGRSAIFLKGEAIKLKYNIKREFMLPSEKDFEK